MEKLSIAAARSRLAVRLRALAASATVRNTPWIAPNRMMTWSQSRVRLGISSSSSALTQQVDLLPYLVRQSTGQRLDFVHRREYHRVVQALHVERGHLTGQ